MNEILFKEPQDYLTFELGLRQARRPSYSMRAFARDLAISPSSLNDFLKARVGMSEDRIAQLASSLRWDTSRTEHFRDLVISKFDRDRSARSAAAVRVRMRLRERSSKTSLEVFSVMSEWYHLAIMELCSLVDGLTADQVATELKLKRATAKRAVRRLLNLGLLNETPRGLKPDASENHFGDAGQSEAIKAFHAQILKKAEEALHANTDESHDSHSLIFSVAARDIPVMNAEIRRSLLEILNRYASDPDLDSIQALTLQSFPVWKGPS